MTTMLMDGLSSGRIFGLVAFVQLFELLLLGALRCRTGRGPPLRQLAPMLSAGLGLSAAALLVFAGAPPLAVGAALAFALVSHLFDVAARFAGPAGGVAPAFSFPGAK